MALKRGGVSPQPFRPLFVSRRAKLRHTKCSGQKPDFWALILILIYAKNGPKTKKSARKMQFFLADYQQLMTIVVARLRRSVLDLHIPHGLGCLLSVCAPVPSASPGSWRLGVGRIAAGITAW